MLLSGILLELCRRLRIQTCHYFFLLVLLKKGALNIELLSMRALNGYNEKMKKELKYKHIDPRSENQ